MAVMGSCGQKQSSPAPDYNNAQVVDTLRAAVVQENKDFYKKDLAVWGRHFAHTPAVYWICVEDDVTLRAMGWKDLEQFVGGWMKENPVPVPDSLLQKDRIEEFHAQIADRLAFVRYKKTRFKEDGTPQTMLEQRTFEREPNGWKIIGMTSAPGYDSKGSTGNVFVHGK